MKTLVLAAALFLVVPVPKAQQTEAQEKATPQTTQQETTVTSNVQTASPESIKPGHPLDPADIDILTGKRDREIAASRRANTVVMGGYGAYATNAGRSGMLDPSLLPLRRVGRPIYFFSMAPGGFGSRSFGRR